MCGFVMFLSRWMPCEKCGESVERGQEEAHVCNPERLLDYEMFKMRDDIAQTEQEFAAWLKTSEGRFNVWLAAREVRRSLP